MRFGNKPIFEQTEPIGSPATAIEGEIGHPRSDVLSSRMMHVIEDLAGDWRRLDERIEGLSTEIKGCGLPVTRSPLRLFAGCELEAFAVHLQDVDMMREAALNLLDQGILEANFYGNRFPLTNAGYSGHIDGYLWGGWLGAGAVDAYL